MTAKKHRRPPIPQAEREQVHYRQNLGLEFGLREDEHGRKRLAVGTAEATRRIDRSKAGIYRLRTADPLSDLASLSSRQKEAGIKYREAYEGIAQSGLHPATWSVRVDGGDPFKDIPASMLDAWGELRNANAACRHRDVRLIVEHVCGLRLSLREVAKITGDARPAITKLLSIGLDLLADHYYGPITLAGRRTVSKWGLSP